MTNDEIRMTKEAQMPNIEARTLISRRRTEPPAVCHQSFRHSDFVILSSFVIRHSHR